MSVISAPMQSSILMLVVEDVTIALLEASRDSFEGPAFLDASRLLIGMNLRLSNTEGQEEDNTGESVLWTDDICGSKSGSEVELVDPVSIPFLQLRKYCTVNC